MAPPLLVKNQFVDRHLVDKHFVDRHLVDRHWVDRHLVDRHLVNRHLVNRHLVNRRLVNRHLVDRHLVDRQKERIEPVDQLTMPLMFGTKIATHKYVVGQIIFDQKTGAIPMSSIQSTLMYLEDIFFLIII
jgi:hypothetical protein